MTRNLMCRSKFGAACTTPGGTKGANAALLNPRCFFSLHLLPQNIKEVSWGLLRR